MSYIKTLWKDGVTLIDAEKLNKMEEAIRKNDSDISTTDAKFDRRVNETNTNVKNLSDSTDRRFKEANDRMNIFDETLEGSFVTCTNTLDSIVKDIKILGATYQNPNSLTEIKASGVDNGDGTFTYNVVSHGVNLFNSERFIKFLKSKGFEIVEFQGRRCLKSKANWEEHIMHLEMPLSGTFKLSYDYLHESRTGTGTGAYISVVNEGSPEGKLPCYTNSTQLNVWENTSRNLDSISIYDITLNNSNNATTYIDIDSIFLYESSNGNKEYEPYKEVRITITLAQPLEEHDVLYYDKKEEAWCIAKYNTLYTFTGAEEIVARQDILVSERSAFEILRVGKNIDKAILDKFKYLDNDSDVEHFRAGDDKTSVIVFVNKSSLDVNSVEGFRSWMTKVGLYMKYPADVPNKIVLPKDIQIRLNQYLGTTYAFVESGDVDAKLKITFNKSLGSAVQTNAKEIEALDVRVANIEGLKESQDMAYSTDKGYLVCKNTKNGSVKDLKLTGKSYVQVYPQLELNDTYYHYSKYDSNNVVKEGDYITITGNGVNYIDCAIRAEHNQFFKPSTLYTFFVEIATNTIPTTVNLCAEYANRSMFADLEARKFAIPGKFTGIRIVKATTKDESWFNDTSISLKSLLRTQLNLDVTGSMKYRVWAVEGDVNEELPFFTGILSAGSNVDVMKLSTIYSKGSFLPPTYKTANFYTANGSTPYIALELNIPKGASIAWCAENEVNTDNSEYLMVSPTPNPNNAKNMKIPYLPIYSKGEILAKREYIVQHDKMYLTFWRTDGIVNQSALDAFFGKIGNLSVYLQGNEPSFEYKSDEKSLMFKDSDGNWKPIDELRGLTTTSDTVLPCDNKKHYYYKSTNSVVVDGSEVIATYEHSSINEAMIGYSIKKPEVSDCMYYANAIRDVGLCNMAEVNGLGTSLFTVGKISITVHSNGYIYVIMPKSMKVLTVENMRDWLHNNNLQIVYPLAEKKVFEVASIFPNAFEGGTVVRFYSGVVNSNIEFKVTSNINSFISVFDERLDFLEDNFYKQNLATLAIGLNTLNNKLELEAKSNPETV